MSSNAERLAAAVLARRLELDVTQMDVWHNGGPSNSTLTVVENGVMTNLSRTTARKLDIGLDWEPGSAVRVWKGEGEPKPIVGGQPQDQAHTYVAAPGATVEQTITNEDILREVLRSRADYDQLRAEVRSLSERMDKLEQPGP